MRFVLLVSCVVFARAQLLVQPTVKEETLTHKLKVGEKDVDVSMTIKTHVRSGTGYHCEERETIRSYSGYFDTGPVFPSNLTQRKLFFWLFESRRNPLTDPLVMWMTGGPGCSGMLAAVVENGPCTINADGTGTLDNPNSWTTQANVMWIDQPAGTGFSVGANDGLMYESIVGEHVYGFLQNFFQYPIFTKYQTRDFFITGESYGGHYVPSVAHRIWQGNEAKQGLHINLKGIAIGNGLTDPLEQYQWYPQMAYDGGQADGGTAPGVVGADVYEAMQAAVPACEAKIAKCVDHTTYDACVEAQSFCNNALLSPYQATGMNQYDQRIKCDVPGLCYNFTRVSTWLNDPTVQTVLGVDKQWQTCNYQVNAQFQGDWMLPQQNKLIPLLDLAGIRVLIYAGDCDFVCNWLGNKHWTLGLEWAHKAEYNAAKDQAYLHKGADGKYKEVGKFRNYDNDLSRGLTFLQVYGAGHMVPMDQPEVSLQFINEFLTGVLSTSSNVVV